MWFSIHYYLSELVKIFITARTSMQTINVIMKMLVRTAPATLP